MFETFALRVAAVLPRVRGPLQLAGLIFTVFSVALIRHTNPDNAQALALVGAIGIGLVAIPLSFHRSLLNAIPKAQRAVFMLLLMAMLLISFGAMAYITINATSALPPRGARFDTSLNAEDVVFFRNSAGGTRMQIKWKAYALGASKGEDATIFVGLVSVHDEEKVGGGDGLENTSALTCEQVESCVGSRIFKDLFKNPIFVRAGENPSYITATVEIKKLPKTARVWWEFYQLEGVSGAKCGVNHDVPGPIEGIPPLAQFKDGKIFNSMCYRSIGQSLIKPSML